MKNFTKKYMWCSRCIRHRQHEHWYSYNTIQVSFTTAFNKSENAYPWQQKKKKRMVRRLLPLRLELPLHQFLMADHNHNSFLSWLQCKWRCYSMFNLDVVSGTLKFILTVSLNYSTKHKSLNLGAAALTMECSFLALLHIIGPDKIVAKRKSSRLQNRLLSLSSPREPVAPCAEFMFSSFQ